MGKQKQVIFCNNKVKGFRNVNAAKGILKKERIKKDVRYQE